MRTFAYCAESYSESVRRAAAVAALTCPPWSADTFHSSWLDGFNFYYFKLHGAPCCSTWFGDAWQPAITQDHIINADLAGAIIFCACCNLVDDERNLTQSAAPMLHAMFHAGAIAVVAGAGANYAAAQALKGADVLGMSFRRGLQAGLPARQAYILARGYLQMRHALHPTFATADTLGFRLFIPS